MAEINIDPVKYEIFCQRLSEILSRTRVVEKYSLEQQV